MMNNNNEFYQNSLINARKDNDEWKNAAGTCSANTIEKTITENGTYTATSDNTDGYSKVTVDVEPYFTSFIGYTVGINNVTKYARGFYVLRSSTGIYDITSYTSARCTLLLLDPVVKIVSKEVNDHMINFTPAENYDGIYVGTTKRTIQGDTVTAGDGKLYGCYFWVDTGWDMAKANADFAYTIE